MSPAIERANTAASFSSLGMANCFEQQRTGVMSVEEQQLLEVLNVACRGKDLKTLNRFLTVPEGSVHLACTAAKNKFVEPDEPVINIEIKNLSDRPINVLEMNTERLSVTTYGNGSLWENDYYISTSNYSRYIKIIEPDETYRFDKQLSVEKYGQHRVRLSFTNIEWKELTQSKSSVSHKVIANAECEYLWETEA